MKQSHKDAISRANMGHPTSNETRIKIGLANRGIWIKYSCDNCKKECEKKQSHFKRSTVHFCGMKCFKIYQSKIPFYLQNAYKGVRKIGESKQVYHRRYAKSHPENISHLKARRYSRERGAEGSHTLKEWKELCKKWRNTCSKCRKKVKLTKDHIKPLSLGGSDYISNIQPLCRSCNSKKWKFYSNPDLLSNSL